MKNKLLTLLIGVSVTLALVAVPLMTACAPEVEVPEVEVPEVEVTPAAETAKVGAILPLSGPAAMWGLPGLTGLSILQDRVNAAGGITVGDKRYYVEVIPYDDEYVASKALDGAKKMVLDHKVKFIILQSGPPCTGAMPFLTDHKVLASDTNHFEAIPDRPYLLAIGDNWPLMDGMELEYLAKKYPEIKDVAFTCQDDELGWFGAVFLDVTAEAYNWDVVYSSFFSVDTVDFAPVVSALLAGDPDLVILGGMWSEFRSSIVEQLYLQGYTGYFQASEWDLGVDLAKVPEDYLEGAVAALSHIDDPRLPPECKKFWDDWEARYGPGAPEDVHRDFINIDWETGYVALDLWIKGVEEAGTFDTIPVRDTMLSWDPVPFLTGPSHWWGEELYGCNRSLAVPQYITELHGRTPVIVDEIDLVEWWERYKVPILEGFEEYGVMWWK